ncbi:MAG TPA: TRAP transporter substrate-binding protein [Noviherbaspirillum sp.]|uniref:TRAP transporter substrate-binding protein n=1 Tax=Noviherbaspirillum sp. TaxID=1926288 RepID=UPI002B45E71C|nr:TRAP transporter substrate-binding protein [Noviherbaspirillum sp.]HJV87653.1 TRAP transporter substrate-binding protein [Noviherbaspirillum sp.]
MKPMHKLMALAIAALLSGPALAQINAKFAVTLPEKSHQGQGVAKFVELVDAKSKGQIKIKPFYSGALGNDVQVTSALQGGTIEFTVPQTTTLTGMVKEFEILDFPFLFSTEQEAEKVLDGPTGQKLLDKLPAKGLVGLAYWENGFFNATNSKHPIAKVEDFQGLKFRAIQAKISQETIKALGANPVPLAVPELYTALETHTVDGQGTPTAVIAALKLNEVQKYLSLTKHAYGAFVPLVSKKFWDKLSEADRKILRDAATEARTYQRKVARDQAASAQTAMAAKGMQVNDVTPAERSRMRAKVKPVWDMFSHEVGQDTFAEVTRQLDTK